MFSISFSQSKTSGIGKEGTVFYKNGTQEKGFIKIDKKNHIWFRKNKDSDEVLYNFKEVVRFNTLSNKGTLRGYHYELVPSGNKTKVILVDEAKDKGTLFFKDKTQKKGIITFKNNNVIFKENVDSEKKVYDFNTIYKLSVNNDKRDVDDYEYKLVVKNNKIKVVLLKSIIIGSVILLSTTNSYIINDPNFGISSGLYTAYYLSKDNDLYATKLLPSNIYNYHFRKNIAPSFFGKCEELMKIINDKTFGKSDIKKVVNYYNNECNK